MAGFFFPWATNRAKAHIFWFIPYYCENTYKDYEGYYAQYNKAFLPAVGFGQYRNNNS